MKGFKDKSGKFRPTTNKNGVRMKRDKSTHTTGVKVKSVSLKPNTIQKVNKQIIKDLNKGKSANFSGALNEVVEKARLEREGMIRLIDTIKNGDKVTIVTQHGQQITGRAIMWNDKVDAWVINTGGTYGTPTLAFDDNIIKVVSG